VINPVGRTLWPHSRLWLCLAAIGLIDLAWLGLIGHKLFLPKEFLFAALIVAFFAFAALRWIEDARLRAVATGSIFVMAAWPTLRLFNHLTMTTDFPMQDELLAHWDAVLGLDWLGYARWLDGAHFTAGLLAHCYNSLTTVSCVVFLAIVLAGDLVTAGEFLVLFFAAAVLMSVTGLFFPAAGAMAHYVHTGVLRYIRPDAGTWFVAPLRDVRNNPGHVFDISVLPGLTAFPSFHTAMGVIILYCCRTRIYLLAIAGAYVPMMIAAALVFGGHYFVDIIAGAVATFGLIGVLRLLKRSRSARPAGYSQSAAVLVETSAT